MKKSNANKNKEKAVRDAFENRKSFKDFAGRKVTKENAEVDRIVPGNKGGKYTQDNIQVVSQLTNREKSDKMSGTLRNGVEFKVNKNKGKNSVTVRKKK